MAFPKSKIAAAAMLNFYKSGILGYSNSDIANVCQAVSISNLKQISSLMTELYAENLQYKLTAAAILICL